MDRNTSQEVSSGVASPAVFWRDNTMMPFGDAKKMTEQIVKAM